MIEERYFEEYELGAERRTLGRTITETDVVLHAGQTGDFYPHHMDAEWCKTQEFGQRVAHGTLIFSVAVGMTAGAVNPVAVLVRLRPVALHQTGLHRRHDFGASDDRRETRAQAARPRDGDRAPGGEQPARRDGARCDHLLLVQRRSEGGAELETGTSGLVGATAPRIGRPGRS
jgi:hypothetical protein